MFRATNLILLLVVIAGFAVYVGLATKPADKSEKPANVEQMPEKTETKSIQQAPNPTPIPKKKIKSPAKEIKSPEPETKFITMEQDGNFYPHLTRVKKGGGVIWTNKSSMVMWPAAGPHPTHDQYQEFDSQREILPGETYSFIFEKIGTWQYHNHRSELKLGVVEVTE